MKQRGFLKSKDHANYLIAYASFVMSFTDIAPDYVTFMAMYSSDMCELFDPCLTASGLALLKKKIFETRSTQEGLFPESEQIFIFHEIIDIVNHILKFGHLKGLMCFAGERANGNIASCVSRGGVNYMKTLFSRYVLKEELMLKHFLLNDSNDYDNDGIYSDFTLKMFGKSEYINHFDGAVLGGLYKVVYNFLQTQGVLESSVLEASPFYRLYSAFEFLAGAGFPSTSNGFFCWLEALNTSFHRDTPNKFVLFFVKFVDDSDVDLDDVTDKDILECLNGTVYFSDIQCVAEGVLSQTKFQSYDNFIVKGVRFKSRGSFFAVPALRLGEEHNNLTKMHGRKKHYSCVARVRKYSVIENNGVKSTTHKIQFAWVNCVFRLNLPCDTLVHGLALAHCALRDGVYSEERWQYSIPIDKFNSNVCPEQFTCLNYIDSSPIASSCFNDAGKVLLRTSDMGAYTASSNVNTNCYATPETNILSELYLIPLKPERLNIIYGNVLQDVDRTLTLEKDCYFK
jgi:hypothetical protein